MKFDDLDQVMRRYETALDQTIPDGIMIVARLDGRGFTRLTKETLSLDAPFDTRFRDAMSAACEHLMTSGFRIRYTYTQSDEISILFDPDDDAFGRKVRKLVSVLAGEASAAFSIAIGAHGAFDARLSVLPSEQRVIEYFRWRQEDAHRNALNASCYWKLRESGADANASTKKLEGMSTSDKNELLFSFGLNFNELPAWQRRGIGFIWSTIPHKGRNPITGEIVQTDRRRIKRVEDLPMKEEYEILIRNLISGSD